jgi:hypothetical protein
MQPSSGSYDQVLKALAKTDRGSYTDLSYMPVFRASALFYAVVGKAITTRVSFLNYWREKNNNPDVGVMLTIRDAQGAKRARTYTRLREMTYSFDLRDFVEVGEEFCGSIEVEAFSGEDLKFQFPGLSVFYETPRGVSYVHTNQRVYNSVEDRDRGVELNPWQTGFEIDTARFDPFIFVVNGPVPYAGGDVDFVALNARREEMHCTLALAALPAYGALDLRLKGVAGLADFLGSEPGMCKVDLPLKDVHLRLGVGNALPDQSWLSVTHSYFDATEHVDYFNTATLDTGIYPAFIPFNLVDGLDVDLVLYPIYARATLALRLEGWNSQGQHRFDIDLGSWRTPEDGLCRLDVRRLLAKDGQVACDGLYVLQIKAEDHRLPARITYGLNFRVGEKLGTNISASAYLAKSWGLAKRTWKWGPVVARRGSRNLVMISAFSKEKGACVAREGTLDLYSHLGLLTSFGFRLNGNAGVTLVAEELLAEASHRPGEGEILWYVVKSEHPTLDVNQVCVSGDGFVGGDHCF